MKLKFIKSVFFVLVTMIIFTCTSVNATVFLKYPSNETIKSIKMLQTYPQIDIVEIRVIDSNGRDKKYLVEYKKGRLGNFFIYSKDPTLVNEVFIEDSEVEKSLMKKKKRKNK